MTFGSVALPLALYASLNVLDGITSQRAQQRGAMEGNPVAGVIGIWPAKALGTLAGTLGDISIQHHKHGVWVYRGLMVGLYVGVAVHNSKAGGRP